MAFSEKKKPHLVAAIQNIQRILHFDASELCWRQKGAGGHKQILNWSRAQLWSGALLEADLILVQ
jgi:hypothetical protein